MINCIKMVMAAADRVDVTESGLKAIADEIHTCLNNGANGKLVVITGPPGNGATHVLKFLSVKYPEKYLHLNHDFFSYPLNFTERVADALGVLHPESGLRRTPRYILEMVKSSDRTIVVDDLEHYVEFSEGTAKLRASLVDFITGVSEAKILVATKNVKFLRSLIKAPLENVEILPLPRALSADAVNCFADRYTKSLLAILGVQIKLGTFYRSKSIPVADVVIVIQVALIVALVRNATELDFSLATKDADCYELKRFLEFASPR